MKKCLSGAAALSLIAVSAQSGALDRTGQSVDILFEDGRYVEFSLGYLSPDIAGESIAPVGGTLGPLFPAGGRSGDIGQSNFNFGAGYKADINEDWSYALIVDEPFKADIAYPANTGYFAQDSTAEFASYALTALLQYNMANGFSVYGGPRFQRTDASAAIAFVGDYAVNADNDWGVGFVFGAAYERPEIALRVALTYSSEISHENDVSESFGNPALAGLSGDSVAEFETPQSINLEAQTGIARNTLLFGSIRWVDWSDFDLSPNQYVAVTGQPLLSYVDDITTYTIGLGYRINDTWSVAGDVGYEENTGNLFTNLGPADGQTSVGLAAIYSHDKVTVTTGVRYAWIGDTTTAVQGQPAAEFNDNEAFAFGVKIGYNF